MSVLFVAACIAFFLLLHMIDAEPDHHDGRAISLVSIVVAAAGYTSIHHRVASLNAFGGQIDMVRCRRKQPVEPVRVREKDKERAGLFLTRSFFFSPSSIPLLSPIVYSLRRLGSLAHCLHWWDWMAPTCAEANRAQGPFIMSARNINRCRALYRVCAIIIIELCCMYKRRAGTLKKGEEEEKEGKK